MQRPVFSAFQHSLTALLTSLELLEEDFGSLSAEQVRARIAAMHRGAFWLQGVAENMLCAATIREGRLQLRPQALLLTDVVEEVSAVVTPLLGEQGKTLETSADEPMAAVMADPRRIGQVLINFISNADAHTPHGSSVAISLRSRGGLVRLSVGDRGPALPLQGTDLLESFNRPTVHQGTDTATLGLSLAVSRWLVEAHGGVVGATSRPAGGARFWFELPAGLDRR